MENPNKELETILQQEIYKKNILGWSVKSLSNKYEISEDLVVKYVRKWEFMRFGPKKYFEAVCFGHKKEPYFVNEDEYGFFPNKTYRVLAKIKNYKPKDERSFKERLKDAKEISGYYIPAKDPSHKIRITKIYTLNGKKPERVYCNGPSDLESEEE